MKDIFKPLARAEGVSFLLILFITMPLKYLAEMPMPNRYVGMAHGLLFVLYVVIAILIRKEMQWTAKELAIVLLCSIIPFGTFWMEKKYLS